MQLPPLPLVWSPGGQEGNLTLHCKSIFQMQLIVLSDNCSCHGYRSPVCSKELGISGCRLSRWLHCLHRMTVLLPETLQRLHFKHLPMSRNFIDTVEYEDQYVNACNLELAYKLRITRTGTTGILSMALLGIEYQATVKTNPRRCLQLTSGLYKLRRLLLLFGLLQYLVNWTYGYPTLVIWYCWTLVLVLCKVYAECWASFFNSWMIRKVQTHVLRKFIALASPLIWREGVLD